MLKIYNTFTRTKEEFNTIDGSGIVRMYSCGPTVYHAAHIGNLRAYINVDILKKNLRANGYGILDVMNITDVGHLVSDGDDGEDKVESAAKREGLSPEEISIKYTSLFMKDMERLHITPTRIVVPATLRIKEMISLVEQLEKKGFTYKTKDGIYYDSSKFPSYFELSKRELKDNEGGKRVNIGEKKNANDFALWKFVKPETIQKWESPWGIGCPGWHIECSAIAEKYLGTPFDIHTGGVDHIPIHHTNEIAQTESATGRKMCNIWFHNEFIKVNNDKMSKSKGNIWTLQDLIDKGYKPEHFRYLVMQTSYRTILNFSFESLDGARNTYNNIIDKLAKHKASKVKTDKAVINGLRKEFFDGLNDDLNTPKALAALQKALKEKPSEDIYKLVVDEFDRVLSLFS
ncbi:MAG: cysteine--tRNA ligase [Christensenellaceae bacterium]|jgi:cysteinyl-tRNA synthetase|nr:cysteine--tRNA ligase [Christensenellaceae bacterium]